MPVCIIFKHPTPLASLSVCAADIFINGSKFLEGLGSSDLEEEHAEEKTLKLVWLDAVDLMPG